MKGSFAQLGGNGYVDHERYLEFAFTPREAQFFIRIFVANTDARNIATEHDIWRERDLEGESH
jgi:hypothetical protein